MANLRAIKKRLNCGAIFLNPNFKPTDVIFRPYRYDFIRLLVSYKECVTLRFFLEGHSKRLMSWNCSYYELDWWWKLFLLNDVGDKKLLSFNQRAIITLKEYVTLKAPTYYARYYTQCKSDRFMPLNLRPDFLTM